MIVYSPKPAMMKNGEMSLYDNGTRAAKNMKNKPF